jgi:hypothetical protein
MTPTLLSVAYAAPVSHWIPLCKEESVIWEVEDFYQKQTYRNRLFIHGANGKLMLSIPIVHLGHQGHQKYNHVQIANEFPWQRNHWKSIQAAYQSSPFFEYYEDEFAPLYNKKYSSLMSFNMEMIHSICLVLELKTPKETTKSYTTDSSDNDMRYLINAKALPPKEVPKYTQVFSDKNGFIPNLSILDVLFNLGPETVSILRSL